MANLETTHFLTETQEQTLIAHWQASHAPKDSENLLLAFKPLMMNIVKKYKYYGIAHEDLAQEAWLGLCTALAKYDASRGVRFASYAKWWVNAYCQDYVMRNWSIVRVGTTPIHKKLFFQLRYLKSKLETIETSYFDAKIAGIIAKDLHTTIAEVQFIHDRLLLKDKHLDQKINENSETTFVDGLADETDSIENMLINEQQQDAYTTLHYRFNEFLDARELDILIKHRIEEPPQTLEDISFCYGLTKERIRQIEKRAVRKLKRAFIALGVRNLANW